MARRRCLRTAAAAIIATAAVACLTAPGAAAQASATVTGQVGPWVGIEVAGNGSVLTQDATVGLQVSTFMDGDVRVTRIIAE